MRDSVCSFWIREGNKVQISIKLEIDPSGGVVEVCARILFKHLSCTGNGVRMRSLIVLK